MAHSFHMPWEDILEELKKNCTDPEGKAGFLPRKPECLKYLLKVHLRVDQQDMARVLKQLTVRPYVLLQLLYYLIEQNHEVFRNKGSAKQLRTEMRAAVEKLYPVSASERHKPKEEQECQLPEDIVEFGKPVEKTQKKFMIAYIKEKSATPGDGGKECEDCLSQSRPASVAAGVSPGAYTDPATARMGAIMRHGDLRIQTGHTLISQWESKYTVAGLSVCHPFHGVGSRLYIPLQ